MPNHADGLPDDEALQSNASAATMDLAELRTLLADMRREITGGARF